MTANQLAYQANLEAQRANRAREAENYRSNRAKEDETRRSNLAKELETNRANLTSEQLKQYEIEVKNLLNSQLVKLLDVDTKQDLADLLGIPIPESGEVNFKEDIAGLLGIPIPESSNVKNNIDEKVPKGIERPMHIARAIGSIFG